jgi:cold shock protein
VHVLQESGVVKWFDTERGYGFILRDDGKELFLHASDISTKGYSYVHEGQRVGFVSEKRGKGLEAKKVQVL